MLRIPTVPGNLEMWRAAILGSRLNFELFFDGNRHVLGGLHVIDHVALIAQAT
jgi:hypothetical protein